MTSHDNVDPAEIDKFQAIANRWWDEESEFKPLHRINPIRVEYINKLCGGLDGKKVLDIGCGGGLLTEAMATHNAVVTGIDMAEKSLSIARLHLYESELEVDYQLTSAEAFAESHAGEFDVVTCLEMLEHVPDPQSVIAAAASLVKPGGHLFFSTINRNPKSFMLAIVGAEYLLNMLPKGTHDYQKLIKPSELAAICREHKLTIKDISGITYNPITDQYKLSQDIDVNYIVHCRTD